MVAYTLVQPWPYSLMYIKCPRPLMCCPARRVNQYLPFPTPAVFRHHAERGIVIFAVISAAVGPQMREAGAVSSGDGVFDFLDRGHDFTIHNKRARRRADLWMILFHGREIWRKNLADDFSIRAILVGRTFF